VREHLRFDRLIVGDENGHPGGFAEKIVVVIVIGRESVVLSVARAGPVVVFINSTRVRRIEHARELKYAEKCNFVIIYRFEAKDDAQQFKR